MNVYYGIIIPSAKALDIFINDKSIENYIKLSKMCLLEIPSYPYLSRQEINNIKLKAETDPYSSIMEVLPRVIRSFSAIYCSNKEYIFVGNDLTPEIYDNLYSFEDILTIIKKYKLDDKFKEYNLMGYCPQVYFGDPSKMKIDKNNKL